MSEDPAERNQDRKPPSLRARRELADQLKERVYLIFAALAVTLAVSAHGHATPGRAFATLVITILGTVLAVFTADIIAHFIAHEKIMTLAEFRHSVRSSFGALSAVALPFIFLGISVLTGWDVYQALLVSAIALGVVLVVLVWVSVRSVRLPGPQKWILLGVVALLAIAVITVQSLAHS